MDDVNIAASMFLQIMVGDAPEGDEDDPMAQQVVQPVTAPSDIASSAAP